MIRTLSIALLCVANACDPKLNLKDDEFGSCECKSTLYWFNDDETECTLIESEPE